MVRIADPALAVVASDSRRGPSAHGPQGLSTAQSEKAWVGSAPPSLCYRVIVFLLISQRDLAIPSQTFVYLSTFPKFQGFSKICSCWGNLNK